MTTNKGRQCYWVERPLICQEDFCSDCQIYRNMKAGECEPSYQHLKNILGVKEEKLND